MHIVLIVYQNIHVILQSKGKINLGVILNGIKIKKEERYAKDVIRYYSKEKDI